MELYWFDLVDPPVGLGFGIGVTAHDKDDALELVTDEFGDLPIVRVATIENVDQLDQNHVRPNMGDFLKRGIWFPRQSSW